MLPITWVFDTSGFGATHFFISRKLCYTKCLCTYGLFSLLSLLFSLAMHSFISLMVVFLFILRLQNKSQAPVLRLVTHATLPGELVMMLPA